MTGRLRFWRHRVATAVTCSTCQVTREYELLIGFDWRDLDALATIDEQHPNLTCRVCAASFESPFAIVEYRPTDPIQVLIIEPATRDRRADGLREALGQLTSPDGTLAGPVATVPAALGHDLLATYSGLLLTREESPDPEVPDVGTWLDAVRSASGVYEFVNAMAAFVQADDPQEADSLVAGVPQLLDPRWTRLRWALRQRWLSGLDEPGREALRSRLQRLEQWALFGRQPPDIPDDLDGHVQALINDPAQDVSTLHPGVRIAVLLAAVESLVSAPRRSDNDLTRAATLADQAGELAQQGYGTANGLARRARNDKLVALLERRAVTEAEMDLWFALAQECIDQRDPLLGDVVLNLAVALSETTPVLTSDEQQTTIALFRLADHLGRIHGATPQSTVRILNNLAAALRRAPLGSTASHQAEAMEAYDGALTIDTEHHVLTPAGRFQLESNILTASVEAALSVPLSPRAMADLGRQLPAASNRAIATFTVGHPDRARALLTLSGLAVEVYDAGSSVDLWEPALLEQSRSWALEGLRGCTDAGLRWALCNAVGAACARPNADGQVVDATAAREAFDTVLSEADIPTHAGVIRFAARNLGQLLLHSGDLTGAREAYRMALAACDRLIAQATTLDTRITEIEMAADSTLVLALIHLQLRDVAAAVQAIESGRQRLTSDVLDDDHLGDLFGPGEATVWVFTCSLGSALIGTAHSVTGVVHVDATTSTTVGPLVVQLQDATTFEAVDAALAALGKTLTPLLEPLSTFLEPMQSVNLVAAGSLSSVPLHALSIGKATPWALSKTIRYMPTARLGARLRRRPARSGVTAVLADPGTDLPGASTAWDVVRAVDEHAQRAPAGVPMRRWLADVMPTTAHLHVACHARVGASPATTRLELGEGQTLTLADLLDSRFGHLDSVVAAACQSAVTIATTPDELLGIAYGFLAAGAAEVVASLWHIDDEVTALLISRLYQQWGQTDIATALARAQRWLSTVTNAELRPLIDGEAQWLPERLREIWAVRLLAPRYRDPEATPFATAAYWSGLMYVGR